MARVCILNYGSGNVRSVHNQMSAMTERVIVSNRVEDIQDATHLVLPGVGAFAEAMKCVERLLPLDALDEEVRRKGKPFLGICVGMQILATTGSELGEHKGLGWIAGRVSQLHVNDERLPHIGWNNLVRKEAHPLLEGLPEDVDFYYVHSYAMTPADSGDVLATARYGQEFCSVVGRENILGVQFHPEKSHASGGKLIENFLSMT
jgi:glutamine amidotransferase